MLRGRKHRQVHSVILCCLLIMFILPLLVWTMEAGSAPQDGNKGQDQSASEGDFRKSRPVRRRSTSETVRLNYFNANWSKVLRKVADATGSELVMHKAPPGHITRYDRNRYSRTDAVRILNRELEPAGFRLLEQGKFLILLHLKALRTRYRRPVAPAQTDESNDGAAAFGEPDNAGRPARGVHFVTTRERIRKSGPYQTAEAALAQTGMRQASHKQETQTELDKHPFPDSASSSGNADAENLLTVATRSRSATEVARVIYKALKPRAELLDAGPKGLPALRVYRAGRPAQKRGSQTSGDTSGQNTASHVHFTIGIDTNREELVVSAFGRETSRTVADLIRKLDWVGTEPESTVQLAPSEKDVTGIAESLQPVLNRLIVGRGRFGVRNRLSTQPADGQQTEPVAFQDQQQNRSDANQPNANQPQPPNQPTGQPGAEMQAGQEQLRIEPLRGPVTIQEVPGIGLVVTGNQDDVEKVMQLIRELERVAGRAAPEFRLHPLKHVDSVALAELLNNVWQQVGAATTLGTQSRQNVNVIAVVRPNALLIIASERDRLAVLELIDELDQPTDPTTVFEVFRLKHAIASQVVTALEGVFQQQQQQAAGGLQTRFNAIADVRSNSVIVQASPNDMAEISRLIRKIDRTSPASVSEIKFFPLKNAVAEELAQVINIAILSLFSPAGTTGGAQTPGQFGGGGAGAGAGGQAAQQLREVKSVVLEFLSTDGDAQRLIRSGVLADVRITADPRSNALIVTAPQQSMELMAELIGQLDQPTRNVAVIKIFSLTNSDAQSMIDLLEPIFEAPDQQDQLGIQVAGAKDASSGLIPLRFSVDVRTNSVIAIGGAEALLVVEAILLRLDETDIRQRRTIAYKLQNVLASDVATAVNAFLQSQRELAQIDPELVSNIELLEREVIVVAEDITNSLLLSVTPRYYDEILKLIKQLDEPPAQVVIQMLIVEVALSNTDEFGVELGFQDSVLFDRGLLNLDNFRTITSSVSNPGTGIVTTTEQIVNQETIPGFLFNTAGPLGNNTVVNPSNVGRQGVSNFSLGRVNGDLGYGGLVLSASSEEISVLIRALKAKRNLQVLSKPQILTLDNQLAQIQVGQQVPVVTSTVQNAFGGLSPVLGAPQQVGIILSVTPRIRPDGTVIVETIATKSQIASEGVAIGQDPTTGTVIESPIFDITEVQATVAVPDGHTVVMGGMIVQSNDTIERKVPWLGDIPWLGTAFRYDSTSKLRTELLIFMTPRIIKNDADLELIKQVETERIHFIEQEAEEIYGPILGAPPPLDVDEFKMSQPDGEQVPFLPPLPPDDDDDFDDVPTTLVPNGALLAPPAGAAEPPGFATWRRQSDTAADPPSQLPMTSRRRPTGPRRNLFNLFTPKRR